MMTASLSRSLRCCSTAAHSCCHLVDASCAPARSSRPICITTCLLKGPAATEAHELRSTLMYTVFACLLVSRMPVSCCVVSSTLCSLPERPVVATMVELTECADGHCMVMQLSACEALLLSRQVDDRT